ncbi:hypothetical protein [Streptomyces lavendulocolor]|uniref:hypothetical protein n=1 Tax=Streptomyces lavendulocolor TaxID=67316 RepID=UPI0033ECE46C
MLHVHLPRDGRRGFHPLSRAIAFLLTLIVALAAAQLAAPPPSHADIGGEDQGWKTRMHDQNYFLKENDARTESTDFPGFPNDQKTMLIHSLHLYHWFWTATTMSFAKIGRPPSGQEMPRDNFSFGGRVLKRESSGAYTEQEYVCGPINRQQKLNTACSNGNIDVSYTLFGTRSTAWLRGLPKAFAEQREIKDWITLPAARESMQTPPNKGTSAKYWNTERMTKVFEWTKGFLAMQNAYPSRLNCTTLPYDVSAEDMKTIQAEIFDQAIQKDLMRVIALPKASENAPGRTKDLAEVKWVNPTATALGNLEEIVDNTLLQDSPVYEKLSNGAKATVKKLKLAKSSKPLGVATAAAQGGAAFVAINDIVQVMNNPSSTDLDYADAWLSVGNPIASLLSRGTGIAGTRLAEPGSKIAKGLASGSKFLGVAANGFNVATSIVGVAQGAIEGDPFKVGIKVAAMSVAFAAMIATGVGVPIVAALSFAIAIVDVLWDTFKPKWVGEEVRLDAFREAELARIGQDRVEIAAFTDRSNAALREKNRIAEACGVPVAQRTAPPVPPLNGNITVKGYYYPTSDTPDNVVSSWDAGGRFAAKELHIVLQNMRTGSIDLRTTDSSRCGTDPQRCTGAFNFEWVKTSYRDHPGFAEYQEFTIEIKVSSKIWPVVGTRTGRDCFALSVIMGDKLIGGPRNTKAFYDPPLICANNTLAPVKSEIYTSYGVPPYDLGGYKTLDELLKKQWENNKTTYFAYSLEIS